VLESVRFAAGVNDDDQPRSTESARPT